VARISLAARDTDTSPRSTLAITSGAAPITNPDAIGPDGRVRLRCYLAMADTVWFSAGCDGLAGCGHVAPISVQAAVRLMGFARRRCGSWSGLFAAAILLLEAMA
jgi:hypothetical protein